MALKPLQPIKTELIAHLIDLVNANLGELLQKTIVACPACKGDDPAVYDCVHCGGSGIVDTYTVDLEKLQQPEWGRHVEGFDCKNGVIVPKMRSKDRAFSSLVKILGLDKAVLELASSKAATETLTESETENYIDQLKTLAALGALDVRH